MPKFNLLKTLGLKKLAELPFTRLKTNIVEEIDRAIEKIESGSIVDIIVRELRKQLSVMIASTGFPLAGFFVDTLLSSFDWTGLEAKPASDVVKALSRMASDVRGWRL